MNRMGHPNGRPKPNHTTSLFKAKGNSDISQEHYLEETRKYIDKSHQSDSADSNSEASRPIAAQIQQKDLEMVNDYMVEDWKDTSGSGSQQTTRNKAKNSHKTKAKGSNGLGIKGSKNLKGPRNLKRPTFSFGSKNGRDVECSNPSSKNRLGYLVQEESGGDSRRGYSTDLCSTDRDLGLVRGRTGPSMEATVPHNSNEHHN